MWSFGSQNFVNMDGSKARVKPPEKLKGVDKRRRSITLTTEMLKERQVRLYDFFIDQENIFADHLKY